MPYAYRQLTAARRERLIFQALVVYCALFISAQGLSETRPGAPPNSAGKAPASAAQEGETPEPPINIEGVLSRSYEEKAREVLETYIPRKEFQVNVQARSNGKTLPRAPYQPKALTPGASLNLSAEELSDYVKSVEIEVLLSDRLKKNQRQIEAFLTRGLRLNKNRGDKLAIGSLGIDVDSEESRKEKLALKDELDRLKSQADRTARELDQKRQEAEDLRREQENFLKNPYFIGGIAGGIGFILLVSIFLIARSMSTASRNLGGALGSIAQAMENVGGSISSAKSGEPTNQITSLEAKMITDGGGGGGKGGGGMATLPIESIQAHLLKVRHELLEALNERTEAIIVRHITQMLGNPNTAGRAIVAMELLGRDSATELFKRLGVKAQETVMQFLREGTYEKPKVELMLEVGEELKTKLLVESFDRARGKPSEKVAERVVQLSQDELIQVTKDIDDDYLPRLLVYLDPEKVAKLLEHFKKSDDDKYRTLVAALPQIPEAESSDEYDDAIITSLDEVIDQTKQDNQRPYFDYYKKIVAQAGDEIGEDVLKELSNDERLATYFRENVITLQTLFVLSEDLRNELLEALSNKDVAAIATGLKEEDREALFNALAARRRNLVSEEYESLAARGGRNTQIAFKKAKDILVRKMNDMKNEGTLVTTAGESSGGGNDDDDGGGEDEEAA